MPEGYCRRIWVVSVIIQVFDFAGGHTHYEVQITDINSLD